MSHQTFEQFEETHRAGLVEALRGEGMPPNPTMARSLGADPAIVADLHDRAAAADRADEDFLRRQARPGDGYAEQAGRSGASAESHQRAARRLRAS